MRDATAKECPPILGPEIYAPWRQSALGRITDELEERLLLELAGDPRARDILDIGCGDGRMANLLAEGGAHVTGIDPSESMLATAKRVAEERSTGAVFRCGKAEQLPFGAARFDLVVANTILCFVDDAPRVFAEIARVLRPGGRLVIGELGRWSLWALQRYIRGRFGSPLWRHGNSWTASELRSLAENAGLSVTEIRGSVFYPRTLAAARFMARFDARLGRLTTLGAAYVALSATKDERSER